MKCKFSIISDKFLSMPVHSFLSLSKEIINNLVYILHTRLFLLFFFQTEVNNLKASMQLQVQVSREELMKRLNRIPYEAAQVGCCTLSLRF